MKLPRLWDNELKWLATYKLDYYFSDHMHKNVFFCLRSLHMMAGVVAMASVIEDFDTQVFL